MGVQPRRYIPGKGFYHAWVVYMDFATANRFSTPTTA